MSVLPAIERPSAVNGAAKPEGFWQRIAQALDAYFVDRSRRAVPAAALRRSKHDIDRCRRLMPKSSAIAAAASESRRLARI
jgi:hypothetical protein